ncbi:FAD binding domain-containing protein [Streptomyces boninensis]|uniref:FAD binding domain-containing protein n=1 Tax=Streptomyces boninensis TaxID=2039455 RepID=UPI003B226ABA
MKTFAYERATDAAAARAALAEPGTQLLAGGTELLNWMKEGIAAPDRVVDINALPYDRIEATEQGLHLGALARMSDVAAHPDVARDYPVLAEALLRSASPQLRNMASIGGNLMQRTRCPYFRADTPLPCNQREPGSGCVALHGGSTEAHAIFGGRTDGGPGEQCVATHPSDMAVALAALDAEVIVLGAGGERRLPIAEFYVPEPARRTALEPGELITGVTVPAAAHTSASHYLKVRERVSYEFAVVSAAAAVTLDGTAIASVRLALGAVAHRPWRLPAAEEALRGVDAGDRAGVEAAVAAGFADATPLPDNAFKVTLARRAAVRALREAVRTGGERA